VSDDFHWTHPRTKLSQPGPGGGQRASRAACTHRSAETELARRGPRRSDRVVDEHWTSTTSHRMSCLAAIGNVPGVVTPPTSRGGHSFGRRRRDTTTYQRPAVCCSDSAVSRLPTSDGARSFMPSPPTPSYLSDLLAVHIPAGPTRRSSTRPLLTVPYVASNFTRRSFCFVSPTVWNSLPSDVQSSPSQATFKSRLKTHLFNIAFNDQPEL